MHNIHCIYITCKTLYYTGGTQVLVTTSNVKGTIYYSTTTKLDSSNYSTKGSESIPSESSINEYTIYYYVKGDTYHNDKSGVITSTILKDKPMVSVVANRLVYNKTSQSLVTVTNPKNSKMYYSLKKRLSSSNR